MINNLSNLVSIIMPSYNSENFIAQTIESVLAQTYKNWELIISDDCSRDSSIEIIESYAKEDIRIHLITLEKNSGPAIARNIAIEKAQGKYIAFLDSDDIWISNKLEKQINFMENKQISFSFSSYQIINEDGKHLKTFYIKIKDSKINYFDLLKTNSIGCLTAVYNQKILGKIYIENVHKEDYSLWLKILKKVDYAYGIQEPLAKYRIHKNSISANKLKASQYQWKIYRDIEKLSIIKSIYYFMHYTWNGLKKHKGLK